MRPRVCVFELTLRCDARCRHCGSGAGAARPRELDRVEALRLVEALADLGCESVTFSGGEPLLRADWPELARAVRRAGMELELITNGLNVLAQRRAILEAGFRSVTFSVDGIAATHDRLRGVPGGLARLLEGVAALREEGLLIGAVTQINRLNSTELEQVGELLVEHGFEGWQVQPTLPQGRAAGQREALCLEPAALPELARRLLAIKAGSPELFIQAADNLGYLSRDEPRLRTGLGAPSQIWAGCQAGREVVGVTSEGQIRGCLSLPPAFDEGSLRERSLRQIWEDPRSFAYNRGPGALELTGHCRRCPYARVCRGGCTSLAWATAGTTTCTEHCLFRLSRGG